MGVTTMAIDTAKEQVFNIVYLSSDRPDPSNLALVRAVEKVASLWARDAREALSLFDLRPPRNVHAIKAIVPAGVDRANWMEAPTTPTTPLVMAGAGS